MKGFRFWLAIAFIFALAACGEKAAEAPPPKLLSYEAPAAKEADALVKEEAKPTEAHPPKPLIHSYKKNFAKEEGKPAKIHKKIKKADGVEYFQAIEDVGNAKVAAPTATASHAQVQEIYSIDKKASGVFSKLEMSLNEDL